MGPRRGRRLEVFPATDARLKRQSVTVDKDVRSFINQLRGGILANGGEEFDFTSCLNALARLGIEHLRSGTASEEEWAQLCTYLRDYPERQHREGNEAWIAEFMRARLPKIVERLNNPPALRRLAIEIEDV